MTKFVSEVKRMHVLQICEIIVETRAERISHSNIISLGVDVVITVVEEDHFGCACMQYLLRIFCLMYGIVIQNHTQEKSQNK